MRIGLVGARGYVGAELMALLAEHPALTLAYAASRQGVGEPVVGAPGLTMQALTPETVAGWQADAVVLALPNDLSRTYVPSLAADTVIVDLSADHRFDPAWVYGLPERGRAAIVGARRIANPGCYATGMQLGLGPLLGLLDGAPQVFGISGYSGAGTTPSPRNDPERLRDNIVPYALVGHLHAREVSHQLGRAVHFTPHVAGFFRGISLTIAATLTRPETPASLLARFNEAYADEPLVAVGAEIPEVALAAGRHGVSIGGFATEGHRAVLVVTLDNLLKGAATQALQNLNLALGSDEGLGVPTFDATAVG
ncbi:MAG: N-acetyl-gamma-glutamyl-phosphate reductase [Nannocystis sp.]|nr:N-acetyl-gamma-glutamyl-phosphate reductase [Nannocystis sp.]MBA3545429.1 N-acetyl-gamma-glutamyl-phosphate reductase [Nannocystis sp.]